MANLDRTLDDIIKMNRPSRDGRRTSGQGPTRRFPDRSATRPGPYSVITRPTAAERQQWSAYPVRFSETRLLVSNLGFWVNDDDILELFSSIGHIKSGSIHYDRLGCSRGTAEVVFYHRRDAETAIATYNNAILDGQPMRVDLVGMNIPSSSVLPPLSHARNERDSAVREARYRDRGRWEGSEIKSAQELDADLDKYRAERSVGRSPG